MTFTFDPDKALAKRPLTVANPAKAANPTPQSEPISRISNISSGVVVDPTAWDYTVVELQEMDRLLLELAELEQWDADELHVLLDERRRMAPVNVRKALAALRLAHGEAMAPWPEPPARRARITLCELTSRRRELAVLPGGKAEPKGQAKSLDSGEKAA
jgi:hypothetical protein